MELTAMEKGMKTVWVRVLKETPLVTRRRASAYLKNIRKTSENEWLIWSDRGTRYRVHLNKEGSGVLVHSSSKRRATANTFALSQPLNWLRLT